MYELVDFLKSLQPKYCALISALISLGIFIFIFIDWFVHKNYGILLIDLIYSKLYSIAWIFGSEFPVSTRSKNYLNNDDVYCSGLDSKVWRNHLSLFRSCEYDLFEKETKLSPLTNYDMNFTSVDQQSFFTCYNDNFCSPEFELMCKVWRLRDKRLRILCSYKALELNSNCSPALILLSEERAKDFETVEKILRLALKAAENNFNKSKLLIDTFDLKDDLIVNTNENSTLIDNSDKSTLKNKSTTTKLKSSSTTTKSSFKCSDFTNLNNLMNNFKFHNIDKEVNELLKDLYKEDGDEYLSIIKVLNLKLNFDNNQKSDLEKDFFNLNELILNEIDDALGNVTPENLSYKNYLFTEELIRDYKILLYIKRRLGMCLRRINKLDEALKLFKELNKELPTVGNFSCLENLMEIYLELEAYSELQLLLNRYDEINMPKSACLVYTAALMKIRNCCEKYQNLKEPPLYSSFLSYNYFNEVNYFQSPDIHVVNTVNKIMNSTTTNQQFITSNDSSIISNNLNSSSSITNQNCVNHNSTQLKNGHNNSNGYSNGILNHSNFNTNTNNTNTNNLINGHNCNGSPPLTNLNTNVTQHLRNEMLALEEIYRAVEFNPIIPIYLLEYKQLTLPTEHIIRRGDTEALAYSFFFLKHWKSIPGALQMLELTWKNAFKLINSSKKKGHLFYPYPLFVFPTDRMLIPAHFEVSIYPTKDSSILFMCIISACLVFIFFLALINRQDFLTTDFLQEPLSIFLKSTAIGSMVMILYIDHIGSFARVQGQSMSPTLNPELVDNKGRPYISKDVVYLDKLTYKLNNYNIERGDIVALKSPKNPNEYFLKRVIALENDVIRTSETNIKEEQVFQIPKGSIWIEGDNNFCSYDSKHFGVIPIGLIFGKATHIIWPINRWKSLDSKNYKSDYNARILRMFQKNSV